jgi:hypothetical protein
MQEFPRAGSRSTPVHPAADFVWKDYAPSAFRYEAAQLLSAPSQWHCTLQLASSMQCNITALYFGSMPAQILCVQAV